MNHNIAATAADRSSPASFSVSVSGCRTGHLGSISDEIHRKAALLTHPWVGLSINRAHVVVGLGFWLVKGQEPRSGRRAQCEVMAWAVGCSISGR